MARDFKVRGTIETTDRSSGTVDKVESRFSKFSNFMSLKLVAGFAAAGFALTKLVSGMKASVAAASKQENAVRKLNAALDSMGPAAASVSKELQEYASSLQKVTTAGDETIIEGQALIASFTKNVDEIKAATAAALDLSAATGQNLRSAFLLMGRAASGETSTLTRYGITLEEGLSKSEKFAAAVEKINEQFGGQAQAAAETFSGRMSQLGNAFGDAAEGLGFFIVNSEQGRNIIIQLTNAFATLAEFLPKVEEGESRLARAATQRNALLQEVADKEERLAFIEANRSPIVDFLARKVADLHGGETELEKAQRELVEATDALAKSEEDMAKAFADANKEMVEQTRITKEEIKAARTLGIVLEEDVNTRLNDQRKAIDLLRAKRVALGVSDADLIAKEAELAEQQRALNEAFAKSGGNLAVFESLIKESATSVTALTTASALLGDEQEDLVTSTDQLTESLRRVASQAVFTTRTFDELARTAGRTAAVEAAVAAGGQLVQGGSRINLPGGGSRLTLNRSFSDGLVNIDGTPSRFF